MVEPRGWQASLLDEPRTQSPVLRQQPQNHYKRQQITEIPEESNYNILKEVAKLVQSEDYTRAVEASYNPELEQHYEDLLTSLFVISMRKRHSAISIIQRAVQKTDKDEKDQLDSFEKTFADLLEVHLDFVKNKRRLE